MNRFIMLVCGLVFMLLVDVRAVLTQERKGEPGSSPDNPKQVTSKDKGPDIDPVKLAASPYSAIPLFRTFRSFMSSSYATAGVWVYAEGDEQALYDEPVAYTYPDFYKATWQEVFDHVARQTRCTWSWNAENRQFKFARSDEKPFFHVDLADGWRSEDRGLYVWHAPKDLPFGMDVYYFGHFTPGKDQKEDEFLAKVREHFAMSSVGRWPVPPKVGDMKPAKVAGAEALYLKIDTPRPGGVWRQWSLVVEGHAFLIVSAMPKDKEGELSPAVDKMVETFKVTGGRK